MTIEAPTLGQLIRGLRTARRWTLKEMSAHVDIPLSTLAKVEQDRLTLTYDKLQQISRSLNISLSELFFNGSGPAEVQASGRRSLGEISKALHYLTPNGTYDLYFLCAELRRKKMIPVVTYERAKSLAEFGPLTRHEGEEFTYVVSGTIVVHTEFYTPVTLSAGQSIYIDSTMGHAYVLAEGCDEAVTLCICTALDLDDETRPVRSGASRVGPSRSINS